jgi:putative aldouronate transport system permease protein
VLPGGVNTFYILIMSSFFREIPPSLGESARIDGANEFKIFWSIILPLAKPILATVSLFIIVGMWNEWFGALLYLTKAKYWPLQLHLRRIISLFAVSTMDTNTASLVKQQVYADGIRMASVVVTMLPIMLVYPFLQKYFAKGIMIGAVKG